MKSKGRGKIYRLGVGLKGSMLSPDGVGFALYRLNLDDNAQPKGWHMPLNRAGLVTWFQYQNGLDISTHAYSVKY